MPDGFLVLFLALELEDQDLGCPVGADDGPSQLGGAGPVSLRRAWASPARLERLLWSWGKWEPGGGCSTQADCPVAT